MLIARRCLAVPRDTVMRDFAVEAINMPGQFARFAIQRQDFSMRRIVTAADFNLTAKRFFRQRSRNLTSLHIYRTANRIAAVQHGNRRFVHGDFVSQKRLHRCGQIAANGGHIGYAQAVFHHFNARAAQAADLRQPVVWAETAVLHAADFFHRLPQ